MYEKTQTVWNAFWRDKHGRVVVWQMPNAFLIGWTVFTFASLLVSSKSVADVLSWAGIASLLVWALLEIFKGVNLFRRLLGLTVLALAILSFIHTV